MNGTDSNTSTNANGWAATEMRTFLEGSSGRGQLSNNSYIKQVKKKYIKTCNSASSVTTCNDYLWLLSASEVLKDGYNGGDTKGYAITKEGWLRSPHYSDGSSFCFVTDKGINSNVGNYSYNTYGVAPGFCI